MATELSKETPRPVASASFLSIPGELRNYIYHLYFENTFQAQGLIGDASVHRVESLKPALAVLSTSAAIKREAAPILWVDFVPRCHWGLGTRRDDDDRMLGFVTAVRKYTINVDITFQKRHLNTSDLSANVAWLVLESTFDLPKDQEAVDKLRGEWEVGHRGPSGFVAFKLRPLGSRASGFNLKYCYHTPAYSWVRVHGELAMLGWERIFTEAKWSAASSAWLSEVDWQNAISGD